PYHKVWAQTYSTTQVDTLREGARVGRHSTPGVQGGEDHERHHPSSLLGVPLRGEGPAHPRLQASCLALGHHPDDHAEAGPDGADGWLPEDAGPPARGRHLL